jgi:hypothetical protein
LIDQRSIQNRLLDYESTSYKFRNTAGNTFTPLYIKQADRFFNLHVISMQEFAYTSEKSDAERGQKIFIFFRCDYVEKYVGQCRLKWSPTGSGFCVD